jgi:hypothetical protein
MISHRRTTFGVRPPMRGGPLPIDMPHDYSSRYCSSSIAVGWFSSRAT